jgi:hypothetical protein
MNRREKADEARTARLLDACDQAFDNDAADFTRDDSFESVVLFGVGRDPSEPYPPTGHTYPRR